MLAPDRDGDRRHVRPGELSDHVAGALPQAADGLARRAVATPRHDFVRADRQIARHSRQSDVGDGRVKHFHKSRQRQN